MIRRRLRLAWSVLRGRDSGWAGGYVDGWDSSNDYRRLTGTDTPAVRR